MKTNFENSLIKIIGTDLRCWNEYLVWNKLILEMSDSYKSKFGIVAEKAIEILTGEQKTKIKDFLSGEIKTVSVKLGIKDYLKDALGNLLTYKDDNYGEGYLKVTPYGDNFIISYYDGMTWEDFFTKVENMYFVFYLKVVEDGEVVDAPVINVLNFKGMNYKNLKNEYELIQKTIFAVDINDAEESKKAQKFIREKNKLLVMKRFDSNGQYQWSLMFKDKEVIKYGIFLMPHNQVTPCYEKFEDYDEAYDHVAELVEQSGYIKNSFSKKVSSKKISSSKISEKSEKIELSIPHIKVEFNKTQEKIYKLSLDLDKREINDIISVLTLLNLTK